MTWSRTGTISCICLAVINQRNDSSSILGTSNAGGGWEYVPDLLIFNPWNEPHLPDEWTWWSGGIQDASPEFEMLWRCSWGSVAYARDDFLGHGWPWDSQWDSGWDSQNRRAWRFSGLVQWAPSVARKRTTRMLAHRWRSIGHGMDFWSYFWPVGAGFTLVFTPVFLRWFFYAGFGAGWIRNKRIFRIFRIRGGFVCAPRSSFVWPCDARLSK